MADSVRRKVLGFILLVTHIGAGAFAQIVPPTQSRPFDGWYHKTWSPDKIHRSENGSIGLTLDHDDGSGYGSRNLYLFGYISTAIKLVAGDSSGVVTAYYLSSNSSESDHDELDFEFLGNKSGEPYILQTNVFANGIGRREQRVYLWFDPTAGYHNYSVIWNKEIIIFSVDEVPIRVFKNNENLGVGYPRTKPMGIYSTIWDGESWATRGGRDKIDWTQAPFVASFGNFIIDACWAATSSGNSSTGHNMISSSAATSDNWWGQPGFQSLDANLQTQLKLVKQYYMIYDYCTDSPRYPVAPPECATN
ncbi:unnamed protein product [Calypogeia fissa]